MPPRPPPPPPARTSSVEPFAIPGIDVRLWRYPGPRRPGVPEGDTDYVFREELVRELAWAVWPHDGGDSTPCLLVGPKGCGKTSLVLQVAARANIPVLRANLNVGTTVRHLKGRVAAENGATTFVPGIATLAMEQGAWLLLDEISGATPPVALALFPVLEPDGEVLLEDAQPPRYAKRHSHFRVFGTDNTIGAEQEDSRFSYGGTNPDVNEALLDRFGSTIQVGYLKPEDEHKAILAVVPGVTPLDLEGMIRVARNVRESAEQGTAFSYRMLVQWARRVAAGKMRTDGSVSPSSGDNCILDAAYPAFLARMRSKIERDAIVEVIRRVFEIREGA